MGWPPAPPKSPTAPRRGGTFRPEDILLRSSLPFLLLLALLGAGCTSSPETLNAKLNAIGKSDLQDILNDLPPKAKSAVLAKPYYLVHEFREFPRDSALVYQAYAALIYFYLDPDLGLCQIRKYRYKTSSRIWDRYDVKLKHLPAKYSADSVASATSPASASPPMPRP